VVISLAGKKRELLVGIRVRDREGKGTLKCIVNEKRRRIWGGKSFANS